jgi:hypothetical protein
MEYRYPPSDYGLTGVGQNRSGIALSGGVTSTASGLIFTGDNEGNFIAFDSANGQTALALSARRARVGIGAGDLHARWPAAPVDLRGLDAHRLRHARRAAVSIVSLTEPSAVSF